MLKTIWIFLGKMWAMLQIRCLFDPWIWVKLKIRIRGWTSRIIFSWIYKRFFGFKILKFLMRIRNLFYPDADQELFYPGPGMEKFGSGILDKHPGSATLLLSLGIRSRIRFVYVGNGKLKSFCNPCGHHVTCEIVDLFSKYYTFIHTYIHSQKVHSPLSWGPS